MSQSFEKHAQYTPFYHFFTSPLGFIFVIWSVQRLIANPGADTAYMFVGSLALFGAIAMLRLSALRVQDRIIRLEERLRLARLLPADLQPRIESLRPSHLIALRFASDGEVTDLVRKVLADPTIKPKEIKRQVKNWRADYFRA
jgi:hypothetical protein